MESKMPFDTFQAASDRGGTKLPNLNWALWCCCLSSLCQQCICHPWHGGGSEQQSDKERLLASDNLAVKLSVRVTLQICKALTAAGWGAFSHVDSWKTRHDPQTGKEVLLPLCIWPQRIYNPYNALPSSCQPRGRDPGRTEGSTDRDWGRKGSGRCC